MGLRDASASKNSAFCQKLNGATIDKERYLHLTGMPSS